MAALLLLSTASPCPAQEQPIVNRASVMLAKDVVLTDEPLCNVKTERPLATWRELYFGRQRAMVCTDAVHKLEEHEKLAGADIFNDLAISPEARQVAQDYEDACLIKFSAVTDPNGGYTGIRARSNHLTFMSSDHEIDRLRRSVGSLSQPTIRNYCSASLINLPGNQTGLLTAMHCLGQEMQIDNSPLFKLSYVFGDIRFRPISGPVLNLSIDSDLTGIEYEPFHADLVIAKVNVPEPGSYLPIADFAPKLWEPLIMLGVSPFLDKRATPQARQSQLADLVTVSLEPSCTLISRDAGGQLNYGCQTERSQSGGPITVIRDNSFVVAGVHSRGDPEKTASCGENAVPTQNSGISIIMKKTSGG